jgi:hypothetical protein
VTFDAMRHGIVHKGFSKVPIRFGRGDIWFLIRTSAFLMALITKRFNILMDPELLALSLAGRVTEELSRR